ncbi:hypothetical protein [Saezia sanguinis]|uniref:hypothetical protein n=1 Tax=Saezia sanguinis TaxID=1965230 RepID=UPI003035C40A
MQASKKDEKKSQDDSIQLNQMVKVFILIIGFSIIMRSDLWVSMCALMVVGGYLIRAFLLKKAKNGFNIARAWTFVRQWYEQNVVNKKESKDKVKKAPSKEPPLQFPVIEFEPSPVPAVPPLHPGALWDMDTALSILYGEPQQSHCVHQDIDDDYLRRLDVVDVGVLHQENPS